MADQKQKDISMPAKLSTDFREFPSGENTGQMFNART